MPTLNRSEFYPQINCSDTNLSIVRTSGPSREFLLRRGKLGLGKRGREREREKREQRERERRNREVSRKVKREKREYQLVMKFPPFHYWIGSSYTAPSPLILGGYKLNHLLVTSSNRLTACFVKRLFLPLKLMTFYSERSNPFYRGLPSSFAQNDLEKSIITGFSWALLNCVLNISFLNLVDKLNSFFWWLGIRLGLCAKYILYSIVFWNKFPSLWSCLLCQICFLLLQFWLSALFSTVEISCVGLGLRIYWD